jgi:hypothetical protein
MRLEPCFCDVNAHCIFPRRLGTSRPLAGSRKQTRSNDSTSSWTRSSSNVHVALVLSDPRADPRSGSVGDRDERAGASRRARGRGRGGREPRTRARALRSSVARHAGAAALVVSLIGFVLSTTVVAGADRGVSGSAAKAKSHAVDTAAVLGHPLSTRPYAGGVLLLGRNRKFAAAAIPTVALAKNAQKLDGLSAEQIGGSCLPHTVDLGSWCLESSPYPLPKSQSGENNFIFASKKCVEQGGYLPSAAQLLGAASRVSLESTVNDSPDTATVDQDPTEGLKDQREMSSSLVTTQSGSEAAGSEGVSVGATGNPQTGEPNPVPIPAVPLPETLQYVTVYSNFQKGGFAGSEPVSAPENFRCAYNKTPGAQQQGE